MFWYFVFKSVFYYSKVTKSFADLQRIFLEKMQIFGGYFFNICIFSEVILKRNAYFRRFWTGKRRAASIAALRGSDQTHTECRAAMLAAQTNSNQF
jgi:hypothetical protein